MSVKFEFQDNLSEYLNELQTSFKKEEEYILKELMYSATGYKGDRTAPIPSILMTGTKGYNKWLFQSGQDASRWEIKIGEDEGVVLANYSGMEGYNTADEFKVWIEFSNEYIENDFDYYSTKKIDPYDRTLNRDYAFYQETGADKYADPDNAHHKGYVNKGMGNAADTQIPDALRRNIERLLSKHSR